MTAVLVVSTAVTLVVAVAAMVVALASGAGHDHDALLVAGRMASSTSVLLVVTVVWLADGMHHVAATTDTRATPARV